MKFVSLKILVVFFLTSFSAFAEVDTRQVSAIPKEIYGNKNNPIGLKIGNGGAGPTGILKALAEDFLSQKNYDYSIAWYQDISPNTLQQLKNSVIDIALVYERAQGDKALNEGWATNYTAVFNDHFIIIGPKENPANILKKDSVRSAFRKISDYGEENSQNIFLSRDDNSGTNVKEKTIWDAISLKPWHAENQWYYKFHTFPKEALLEADKKHLYTITDFATFLSNRAALKNSVIYVRGSDWLLNPCFALLQKKPSKDALEFLDYLKSERGQKLIADFGKDKYDGETLFTRANKKDFSR